jgi:hypothetical protein
MTNAKTLLLASSLLLVFGAARAESVGNVGAVNKSARGTPPGAAAHDLSVGAGVVKRERIETSGEGSAQIVFRDASTMTIGRDSAVTIDDFVYNSKAGAGSQGVSVAKGVLRFVGGGVSHGAGAQLRTPTASIGVRGGTALLSLGGPCGTLVVNQYGVATVANSTSSEILTRSGYGVCAPPDGPISEPFLVPGETIANLTLRMASGEGQFGGVANPPKNPRANQRLGDSRPPDVAPAPGLDDLNRIWAGNSLVQSQANADNQPLPPPPQEEEDYRSCPECD